MKKFIKLLCLGLALVFISGCESKDSMEDITIYTSMYPIEYVTKQLYGEHANVLSFYPSDVNPYEYKLTAKQIKDYSSSDLIIYNGLDTEKDYIAGMLNKNKKLKINLLIYPALMRQNAYFFLNFSFMREEQVTAH